MNAHSILPIEQFDSSIFSYFERTNALFNLQHFRAKCFCLKLQFCSKKLRLKIIHFRLYTKVPHSIPMDATEVHLDGNNFGNFTKQVPQEFLHSFRLSSLIKK